MDNLDDFFLAMAYAGLVIIVISLAILVVVECGCDGFQDDYDLGSVVTTTAEYEYLTNDSFTGVVVRGETWDDPALTVRNRDGVERRIATEFLEPMR